MATGDRNVSAKQLGYLLGGISERRVQQLAAEGIIRKEARGRYNLVESVRGYVQFLQEVSAGTQGETESDYGNARSQKMRADADKSIMEAAQLAGSLIPTDIVSYHWNHMVGALRAKLLNIPKKAAPLVQHEHTFTKCKGVLNAAIHECLAELSDYEPPKRHFRDLDSLIAGTSPGSKNQRVGSAKKKTVKRK